jgi:hypothetical protein
MTEQLDYVAKIRAKGCANTGITEEIARELHARPGRRIMAIVELKVVERHEKAEGQNRVDLVIEQVEPAMDQILDDHLRELTRTIYQNRVLLRGRPAADRDGADVEPSVETSSPPARRRRRRPAPRVRRRRHRRLRHLRRPQGQPHPRPARGPPRGRRRPATDPNLELEDAPVPA